LWHKLNYRYGRSWTRDLPKAETAAMLAWALMASERITIRRIDGWLANP